MRLAIDPGLDTGLCFGTTATPHLALVHRAADYEAALYRVAHAGLTAVLIEYPRVYPDLKKNDPNDLITLAIRAGVYIRPLLSLGIPIYGIEPRDWKGQLPKRAHHARLMRDYPHVTQAAAHVAAGVRHNVLDAFGLMTWWESHPHVKLRDLRKGLV